MKNYPANRVVRWAMALFATAWWATATAQEQRCVEIEAILVNSCNNLDEGLNEMVFMRVGNQPIDFSGAYLNQTNIIAFPNNNDFLTPPTPYTTDIINQWNASILIPQCGRIIEVSDQLDTPYTVPAGARLILITSALFDVNAFDFSQLQDIVYVLYAGNTSSMGRFSNTATTLRRFSFGPENMCRDTVVYLPSNLQNVDGATVYFDWDGNPTYASPGCVPPIPPAPPNPISALVNACEGTATLRGPNNFPPYVGEWSVDLAPPGAQAPTLLPHPDSARVTITVTVPGTYRFKRTLTRSDSCGQYDGPHVSYLEISFPQTPTAEWNPFIQSICPNQTVTLSPALPGPVEWFWNGQSLGIAPEWVTNEPGTYTFARTVDGCIALSEPRVLTVGAMPSPPTVSVSPSAPCPGETIVFSANEAVEWFFNQTYLGTGTEWTAALGTETVGTYFARSSNACGFADSEPMSVFIPASLPTNVGISADLNNFCSTGGVLSVVNYVPGFTYRWVGPTTFSNPAAPTQIVKAFGEYGFWISNGCDSSEYRLTVSENDLSALTVSITPSQAEVCPGGEGVELSVSAVGAFDPVEYLWERDGTVVGTGLRFLATARGTYRATVRDGCGRRGTVTAEVVSPDGVAITPGRNLRICAGQSATVQLSGAEDYLWKAAPGMTITDGGALATFSPLSSQTYTCICTYGACAETLTVEVLVISPPSISLESERAEIEAGEEIELRARGNAVEYRWAPTHALSDSVGERVYARPAATTVFTVTAVNALGCETNDTLVVRVKPRPQHQAGVPNVFTPNGDGVNDVFPLYLPDGYDKMNIALYNRWGQKVTSAAWDKTMGARWEWKGVHQNGGECPEGVYVFSVEYTGRAGSLFKTGSVTLIR